MGSGASGPSGSRAEPWPFFWIFYVDNLNRFGSSRPVHGHCIADAGAQQGAGDRGIEADFAPCEVGFVGADDRDGALHIVIVDERDRGTEEYLVAVGLGVRFS